MGVTRRVGAFVRFDLMPRSATRFLRRDRYAERRCRSAVRGGRSSAPGAPQRRTRALPCHAPGRDCG